MAEFIEKISKVYSLLEDEISKKIMEDRIRFVHTVSDTERKCDGREGYEIYESSTLPELDGLLSKNNRILIAGAGKNGIETYEALIHAGYSNIEGFLDNNQTKYSELLCGKRVYPFSKVIDDFDDLYVVICNKLYGEEFYRQILSYGFPKERIYYSFAGRLVSRFGVEYFDIIEHTKGVKEVFLDVGSLNGQDSLKFIDWCKGEYEKIFAIEPSKTSMKMVKKNLKNENVNFINAAMGDKKGEISFYELMDHPGASGIFYKKNSVKTTINMDTIDNITGNDKITFIKMDTEGYEIPALIGAKETIKKNKPILAISVYHNEDDVIEIPLLIENIRNDYKYYLRHYSNNPSDLVLYCI